MTESVLCLAITFARISNMFINMRAKVIARGLKRSTTVSFFITVLRKAWIRMIAFALLLLLFTDVQGMCCHQIFRLHSEKRHSLDANCGLYRPVYVYRLIKLQQACWLHQVAPSL